MACKLGCVSSVTRRNACACCCFSHVATCRRFVLLHPVDNVAFSWSTPQLVINAAQPTQGTAWRFAHFYAATCPATNTKDGPSVTCPRDRRAFTCHTPAADIAAASSAVQDQYYAQKLDSTGFEAIVVLQESGRVITRIVYTWQQTPAGLAISQDVVFGFEGKLAGLVNPTALPALMARATDGDMGVALAQIALHEVEIVGFYPQWLPAIYKASSEISRISAGSG